VSTLVGRAIDRRGGRTVISLGSLLMAAGLVLLALVRSPFTYLLAWAFLGLAKRMCLNDAAFAALVQVTPSRGWRAISYLTLFGGFASSMFWPIAHLLNESNGWRLTLVIFAAINLLVCLPLNWMGLAKRESPLQAQQADIPTAASASGAPPLEGPARTIAMLLFGAIVAARPSSSLPWRRIWCRSWRPRGLPRRPPSGSRPSRAWPRSPAASGI
jgi:MFS family permease